MPLYWLSCMRPLVAAAAVCGIYIRAAVTGQRGWTSHATLIATGVGLLNLLPFYHWQRGDAGARLSSFFCAYRRILDTMRPATFCRATFLCATATHQHGHAFSGKLCAVWFFLFHALPSTIFNVPGQDNFRRNTQYPATFLRTVGWFGTWENVPPFRIACSGFGGKRYERTVTAAPAAAC
jgi:hypothetical protein